MDIYHITKSFPINEKYSLVDQIEAHHALFVVALLLEFSLA